MQISWCKKYCDQEALRKGRSCGLRDHLCLAGAFLWWGEARNPEESPWDAWEWWEKVAWEASDSLGKCQPGRAMGFNSTKYIKSHKVGRPES